MSAGKALIVPDMAGLGSLVKKDETGLLYKPGNVADLAEKIQRLVNNPELAIKMGENAKKEYEIIYSPEVYYRKLMALNQEILCAKSN
jgi:glycosyltransferase involved in cell wall biosynthesis